MCGKCTLLELEIARLRNDINRLQARIDAASSYCSVERRMAARVIRQKSGVERGRWAWNKAAYQVSSKVLEILNG
jgi:hypothetical protein